VAVPVMGAPKATRKALFCLIPAQEIIAHPCNELKVAAASTTHPTHTPRSDAFSGGFAFHGNMLLIFCNQNTLGHGCYTVFAPSVNGGAKEILAQETALA